MGFKPLHDRVLLRRVGEEEKSAGGIIIPDTAQEKPSEGVVVAVGSGVRADDGSVRALDVKEGDQVLFSPEDRHEVEVQGDDFLILRERDVHAIAALASGRRLHVRLGEDADAAAVGAAVLAAGSSANDAVVDVVFCDSAEQAARELECDEDEKAWEDRLRKVAKAKPERESS